MAERGVVYMGNNEPAVDQSDLKILDSYGLNLFIYLFYPSCDRVRGVYMLYARTNMLLQKFILSYGFSLHKSAFRDTLCLRYGWRPSHLPSHCVCRKQFSVEHAMNCHRGGLPSIRHNEIRNITADLFSAKSAIVLV